MKKYLGIIIVASGAAIAGAMIWFMMHVRPRPGAVIDHFVVAPNTEIVIRAEQGSDRNFLELHESGQLKWQALIPHYAGSPGRPAVAYSPTAITVRVSRDGHAEVFAFATNSAEKIGGYRIAAEHEPITTHPDGPITLTDHVRAYELAAGSDWHQIAAVDLSTGKGVWKRELGPAKITDGGVDASGVWLVQDGKRRLLDPATGTDR
ncbi:MAG: PQQ-like beta-propeller repeat protein [Deltaproteobacteria bacterium]|nr:PQQ-like beta-propeller repeat protein [Deltaproteobacteria bacterium]